MFDTPILLCAPLVQFEWGNFVREHIIYWSPISPVGGRFMPGLENTLLACLGLSMVVLTYRTTKAIHR